jgi:hypothetical protein
MNPEHVHTEIARLASAEFNAWRDLREKKRDFEARCGEAALEAAQGDAAARKRYSEAAASIAMLEDVITGARAKREKLLKQALERECAELEREAAELERQADEIARRRMKLEAELREVEGYPIHIQAAQALSSRLQNQAHHLRTQAKLKRQQGPLANGYAEGCSLEELVEAMLRYPALVPAIRDVEAWWDVLSRAAAGHGGPIEAARLVWRNGKIHEDASFVLVRGNLIKWDRTWEGSTVTRAERTTRTLAEIPLPHWLVDRPQKPLPPPRPRKPVDFYRLEEVGKCAKCGAVVSALYVSATHGGPGLCEACYERAKVPEPRIL